LRDWLSEVSRSPVEKAEFERRIQLSVSIHPYTGQIELKGILPPIAWKDLPNLSLIDTILDSLSIHTEGLVHPIDGRAFSPNEANVIFNLDPTAENYKVKLKGTISLPSLDGTWTANRPSPADLFVGTMQIANAVGLKARLRDGDFIYILVDHVPPDVPNYRWGEMQFIGFEVSEMNESVIHNYAPNAIRDTNAFSVDLVLPPTINPIPAGPIDVIPGEQVLLAVIPPPHLDPEFEVVCVPSSAGGITSINPTGLGKPRFYQPQVPEVGSKRLSIHWGSRHNLIHLHATRERRCNWVEPDIRLLIDSGHDVIQELIPWQSPTASIPIKDFKISVVGPQDLPVTVEAYFTTEGRPSAIANEEIAFDRLPERFSQWISEGCQRADILFGPLGSIHLIFERNPWENLSDQELLYRIEQLDPNIKVTWNVIRQILRANPGIPHTEYPTGIRKKVRQLIMARRRNVRGTP
jgi:hypothetical protein